MRNYVKLDRKILDWEWYLNINTKTLFIHMLLKANWKEGRFEGKTIPKGSFVSSIPKLSAETGLTEREIRTSIGHLRATGELTVKTTNKYSVFTVKNYSLYQASGTQSDSLTTDYRHSIDSLTTAIEEDKKENKKEDIRVSKDTLCQTDVRRAVEKWNELSVCGIKPVSKVNSGSKRYDSLCARIREYGIDTVIAAIERIKDSDFLQGKNNRNWIITFDWLVKPSNFPKVLEGNYDNSGDENNSRPRYSADNNGSDQTDSEKCREFWDNL